MKAGEAAEVAEVAEVERAVPVASNKQEEGRLKQRQGSRRH